MSTTSEDGTTTPLLNKTQYDAMKWIAQILLPATGALYFALSTIWGLPAGEQVIGTITVVDVFLGALLSLSSKAYAASEAVGVKYDGALVVNTDDPAKDVYSFEVGAPLDTLANKQVLTIKVQKTG